MKKYQIAYVNGNISSPAEPARYTTRKEAEEALKTWKMNAEPEEDLSQLAIEEYEDYED